MVVNLHALFSANAYSPARGTFPELFSLPDIQGTLQRGFNGIRLEDVPVVAPSSFPHGGQEIVEPLSFVVQPGEHLLISGANGVGKSAIARILAGLWPVYRGLVSRPRRVPSDGIILLPQRPYFSVGTLRDQIIYPHSEVDMQDGGRRDRHLQEVLDAVKLGYLPDREGGWDTRKIWKDVLSGGEKQRVSLARVLYHEPLVAVLDEATSAVSPDVEGILYETAKERGITLITLSTRASLKKYHVFNLRLGSGPSGSGWEYERIGTEEEKLGVERELQDLSDRISKVGEWKQRRQEIEDELLRVWTKHKMRGGTNACASTLRSI
jgi:ATP-binding cassette subfamily D (ALD) long-chain fatty acid import protein